MRSIKRAMLLFETILLIILITSCATAPSIDKVYITDAKAFSPDPVSAIKMAKIAGGTYLMGDAAGNDFEKPVHEVTVSPFMMASTELTYGQLFKASGISENMEALFYQMVSRSEEQIASQRPGLKTLYSDYGQRLGFGSSKKELGYYNLYEVISSTSIAKIGTAEVNSVVEMNNNSGFFNVTDIKLEKQGINLASLLSARRLAVREVFPEEILANTINKADPYTIFP